LSLLARLDALARVVAHAGAVIGGALLLLSALVIGVDVFLRYVFVVSVGGSDELSGYALGIAGAWGFSYALLSRSHIRIDTVYRPCPRALRILLDLGGLAAFMLFMFYVAWRGWGVLAQSVTSNARSISALEAPLALPQAAWVAGLIYFLLVAALLMARSIDALWRRQPGELLRLIGPKAATDEAQEELAGASRSATQREGSGP
jgi:TRAP-type C4-dicarboxylate transport system permease small subunit